MSYKENPKTKWDEQTLSFDLCEQCAIELIDTFQIPAEIFCL